MTPSRLSFAAVLLAGSAASTASTVHAAPALDFLAADLESPVALDLVGDGDLVIASDSHDGDATLVRLDALGARTGEVRSLVGSASDLVVDRRTGHVLVADEAGLAAFDPGFAPLWRHPLAHADARVAVGEHGTVAAVAGDELHILDEHGRQTALVRPGFAARALAVVDAAGLVAVTGAVPAACDDPQDTLALAAFSNTGASLWQAHADARECEAASRGVDVVRGEDDQLYLLAEVDGRMPASLRARAHVVIDGYTDPETARPAMAAYFARFATDGAHQLGQFFALPAEGSVVRPAAIAADEHGNVFLAGTTSHSLGSADEISVTAALDAASGFYLVTEPDFERRAWHPIEADGMTTELFALAHAGDRVVGLLHAASLPGVADGALPPGPSILVWPDHHGPLDAEKRPDPESQGTFGYESGVSGSDPTCYCSAPAAPAPAALLSLGLLTLAGLRRRR